MCGICFFICHMDRLRQFILLKLIIINFAFCSHQIAWLQIEGCCELLCSSTFAAGSGVLFLLIESIFVSPRYVFLVLINATIHERLTLVHESVFYDGECLVNNDRISASCHHLFLDRVIVSMFCTSL